VTSGTSGQSNYSIMKEKDLSPEIPELIGREKEHYNTLKALYAYSFGEQKNEGALRLGLRDTINDWDKMMGGRSNLQIAIQPYLEAIKKSDRDRTRNLYLFLSPAFFYIHILYEMRRKAWRIAVTWGGIFSERIIENLFREIDRKDSSNVWEVISKDQSFENRSNRLRKELEQRHFEEADSLTSFLKSIYFTRSHSGPHDVPPPEPIEADISQRICLPVYVRYLKCLVFLGNDLASDFSTFVSFFHNLAETHVALIFPEEEITTTPKEVIKDLYRQGLFKEGKTLKEAIVRIGELGFHWDASRIAHELEYWSKGKKAFLTRSGKRGDYKYFERYPPGEFFRTTI
jgi:hypothetical protein